MEKTNIKMENKNTQSNPQFKQVKNIKWEWWKKLNEKKWKYFDIPWYWKIPIKIQSISDEALENIIRTRRLLKVNIPKESEIIDMKDQSEYYKKIKEEVLSKFNNNRFAIISWPTWTGKTTLAKTIAYELWLEIYEVWADREKVVDDFAKSIKTLKKGNILQIKEVPWDLLKALTWWWIYLINEANTLSPDVQLALANMLESGFVIIWDKKYKVHPNFFLAFTSNDSYAWTNSYNNAVIRKAGGIVQFDYEPNIEWEKKIVNTLYKNIKRELQTPVVISEQDLNKIANNIRNLRENIRKYNNEVSYEEKILSQDLNDIWHFLYIRFYEKLIKEILQSPSSTIDLKEMVNNLFLPYVQDVIYGMWVDGSYINHKNDIKKLKEIIEKTISDVLHINSNESKNYIDPDLLESAFNDGNLTKKGKDFLKNNFDISSLDVSSKDNWNEKKKNTKGLNTNSFRKKILDNETKSYWEKLKRQEKIEELAQDIYEKLVETHREKIIKDIEIVKKEIYWKLLKININWEDIFFKVKNDKDFDLDSIRTEKDVLNKVFWNDNLQIIYEDEVYENFFSHPKSLEIRRYSKQLEIEKNNKKYIVFLWFKGEIKDIRYIWEESWDYYIPQSKVNDLLISSYEILTQKEIENLDEKHYLALNENWEIIFKKLHELKERIEKGENISILRKINDKKLEEELRERFKNLDKLNLHNWVEEKAETWVPTPIIWKAKPLQSIVEETKNNFYVITEKLRKIIDNVYNSLQIGEDVMLVWPSWVGKTSIAKEVAKYMKLPYIDLQITEDFEEKDISSKLWWNEGELENTLTPFLDFYINGWIVELKELNMAIFTTFLHNFMDKNWEITFQWKVYKRNPNFHIIATVNPFDNRIFYGTKPLNLATNARFKVIHIDYLWSEEEINSILKALPLLNEKLSSWEEYKKVKKFIEFTMNMIVYPIRGKIEELRKTQTESTSEILQILVKKNLTIDTIIWWLKGIENAEELREKLKMYYTFTEEERKLLEWDESLKSILSLLLGI